MKKWASMLVVLGLVGCGAVPVVDEGPPAGQAIPQCVRDSDCDDRVFCNGAESCVRQVCFVGLLPCPGLICDEGIDACRSAPVVEPARSTILPGIYTGTQSCNLRARIGSDSSSSVTTSPKIFVVTGEGSDLEVGQSETRTFGPITETSVLTSILVVENGVFAEADVTHRFSCANSCQYARDGECDEIAFCFPGTDCGDCGQLVLFGTSEIAVKVLSPTSVEYVDNTFTVDRQGFVSMSWQCTVILTR